MVQHEIQVGDSKPIRKPPYRTPYALRQEMQTQVQKMLDKEVIRPSNSPWSAPAILVPKKKGPDGKPRYRFCVDFRALNSVTRFDPYPLPLIEEATDDANTKGPTVRMGPRTTGSFCEAEEQAQHRSGVSFS